MIVIDVSEERDQPLVLINPELVWSQPERQGEEGCPLVAEGMRRR